MSGEHFNVCIARFEPSVYPGDRAEGEEEILLLQYCEIKNGFRSQKSPGRGGITGEIYKAL